MTEQRVRWRMTFDELCYVTKQLPATLDQWARIGAFGSRWREPRDRGSWRHITKEVAHRAIIMSHLVAIGLETPIAANIASQHQTKDRLTPLVVHGDGVTLTINREKLNLP